MNQLTKQVIELVEDNKCVFCGTFTNEDLRKWFGKGGAGGSGDGKEGGAYAACLSKSKARKLGKKGIASFVKRKRAAQKKGGDPKKGGERSKGQKTIKVKTGA